MKLAISNIAWNESEDDSIYKLMKKCNFLGLEIAPTRLFPDSPDIKEKEILQLKTKLEEISVVSLQSILYGRPDLKLFKNEQKRLELFNYLKKVINFSEILGARTIVFGSPKNRISYTDSDYEIAINFFKNISNYAIKHNTNICIEANPTTYETNFINTTEQAIELVKEVNQEGFKLNYDLGTSLINSENISIVEKGIPYLNHVHLSEPFLAPISRTNYKEHRLLHSILKNNKYDKWVSIEMKKSSEKSNYNNIREIMNYVSSIFEGNDE
jgi:sugar phosphate isomerase/epimerase